MSIHLRRELDRLRALLLEQCAQVERNVADAAQAFLERDGDRARGVIDADTLVDRRELEIEEMCLGLLALYQPVATDLRFIFSAVKMNASLERIGDLAENLARKARNLAPTQPLAIPPEFAEMARATRAMLTACVDAFVRQDTAAAAAVVDADGEVDRRKRLVRKYAEAAIRQTPEDVRRWNVVIAAARNLERIADLSAAIAEEVIYAVEGRVVRHAADVES